MIVRLISISGSSEAPSRVTCLEYFVIHSESETILARKSWVSALRSSMQSAARVRHMRRFQSMASTSGVPMAFAAQTGVLSRVAWVLYIAAVLWAAAYDTIYAMIDREDDLTIGVRSSAILFSDMDKLLIGVMQVSTALIKGEASDIGQELRIVIVFDLIFTSLALYLIEFILVG